MVEEAPQMPGALPDEVIEKYLGEDSDEDDRYVLMNLKKMAWKMLS